MTDVKITVGQAEVTGRFRNVREVIPAADTPRQNMRTLVVRVELSGCVEDLDADMVKLFQAVNGE